MSRYKYDRLSAQDNDFLLWEGANLPMHGGSTQIYDVGRLATEDGGVDFDTIRRGYAAILHKLPRYRQKLAWIPDTDRAIWVDDATFNLDYHLRHTALPRPGSEEQLKRLVARLMERPLDRSRPLWELWVVEGLEGNRFATIGKTHHCLVDGSGGMALAESLFSTDADWSLEAPPRFTPRPMPTDAELRADERMRRARLPMRVVSGLRDFIMESPDPAGVLVERARAIGEMAMLKVVPTSDTPINGPVGPHRVSDWFSVSLADTKAIRKALACSINDVVLTMATGAVRDFLISRGVRPDGLEFRVATPVNVRPKEAEGDVGNHVSTWIVSLPVGKSDPLEQVQRIHEKTEALKRSHQAAAIQLVEALHEWIPIDLQELSKGAQNLYVTNVPGPQFPLYLLGAELQRIYIQAPLIENVGLVVAVASYNGRVCVSLVADYDRIPDVSSFSDFAWRAFVRLAAAAGVELSECEKGT